MRITKTRLREIIYEELTKMQEDDFVEGFNPDELEKPPEDQVHTPRGSREQAAQAAFNQYREKEKEEEKEDPSPFDILKGKR